MTTEYRREEGTEEHSFDGLAKGLANNSLSRRDALKWVGAAIMGSLLASIPGVGWAHHKTGHGTPPGHGGTPPGRGGIPPGRGGSSPPPTDTLFQALEGLCLAGQCFDPVQDECVDADKCSDGGCCLGNLCISADTCEDEFCGDCNAEGYCVSECEMDECCVNGECEPPAECEDGCCLNLSPTGVDQNLVCITENQCESICGECQNDFCEEVGCEGANECCLNGECVEPNECAGAFEPEEAGCCLYGSNILGQVTCITDFGCERIAGGDCNNGICEFA